MNKQMTQLGILGLAGLSVVSLLFLGLSYLQRSDEKNNEEMQRLRAEGPCFETTFDPNSSWDGSGACWHPQHKIELVAKPNGGQLAICRCIPEGLVDAGEPVVQEPYDAGEDWP